jgi:hypothetical protein
MTKPDHAPIISVIDHQTRSFQNHRRYRARRRRKATGNGKAAKGKADVALHRPRTALLCLLASLDPLLQSLHATRHRLRFTSAHRRRAVERKLASIIRQQHLSDSTLTEHAHGSAEFSQDSDILAQNFQELQWRIKIQTFLHRTSRNCNGAFILHSRQKSFVDHTNP